MSMDLNREQKRTLKRMGALNEQGAPTRAPRTPPSRNEPRVGPAQYIREVREEMRKVAWPRWPEVRRYSLVVLATVVFFTAVIGGVDSVFGVLSGWLYQD